jgi:hypothetical protein
MVFGLMAFGAVGAHAEELANWLILNSKGERKTGAELPASLQLKIDKDSLGNPIPFILHSKILGIEFLIKCTTINLLNAKLREQGIIGKEVITNEKGLKEGRGFQILLGNCVTELNGKVSEACRPETEGVANEVITNPLHALIKLHELKPSGVKDDLVEVLPDTGLDTTFVTIKTGPATGNECPIGTKVPVFGRVFLRDCNEKFLEHLIEHLVETDATTTKLTELWVISKTEEHKASLLGSAWAFLTGEHEGLKWSGDPA